LQALLAQTRDNQVLQLSLKAMITPQSVEQRLCCRSIDRRQLATTLAEQMMVWMVHRQELVAAIPVTQIEGRNQVEVLQQLEGAIHGGELECRAHSAHPGIDLLRRRVVGGLVQDAQDHLAL